MSYSRLLFDKDSALLAFLGFNDNTELSTMASNSTVTATQSPTPSLSTVTATEMMPNTTAFKKPEGFNHPSTSVLSDEVHCVLMFIYLLVLLVGVSGNSLVCFVLGRKRHLKKGDIFIISLACADLLACTIWPLHMIAYHTYTFTGWFYRASSQSVFYFIFYTTLMVSSWQLVLIAIDRYWAITKLLNWQRITANMKLLAVLFTWILAACIKFPLTWRPVFGYSFEGYKIYLMVWTCLGWVIPLIIIAVLYGICIKTLHESKFQSEKASEATARRTAENQRVVKMFIIIVCLFFIFTIPHSVIDLFRYVDNKSDAVILLHECSVVLTLVNSCTNPFIYAKMHRDINGFIVTTWRKVSGKQRGKSMLESTLSTSTEGTTESAASATSVL